MRPGDDAHMNGARRVKQAEPYKSDTELAELGRRQWGVVTAGELAAVGFSRGEIQTRVRRGQLHPIHRGVYAVGHRHLTMEGRFLAAVKACGAGAVLSHEAAAVLWGLLKWKGQRIHVTAPTRRSHAGLTVHRGAVAAEIVRNLPVTSVARTLTDLAGLPGFEGLRRTVREAYFLRLVTTEELASARSSKLRAIAADAVPTRNLLEDTVLDLLDRAGFERPDVNASQGGRSPDFRWPARGLIIEADGAQAHGHDLALGDDARRTAALEAAGYTVIRVSWRQAVLEPARTLARLRAVRCRFPPGARPAASRSSRPEAAAAAA